MYRKSVTFAAFCLLLILAMLVSACQIQPLAVSEAQAATANDQLPIAYSGEFPRLAFDTVMPTGQSVAVECQDADADYPYTPYDWPDAAATLEIRQGAGMSTVAIEVSNVRPNTYYTMWLRLLGEDVNGVKFGGNPLMGIPGTPLVPSDYLDEMLEAVSTPTDAGIHGFHSGEDGNGSLYLELDFPIINGAYPFQNFEGFDASDERFKLEQPSIPPVAIAMVGAPFTLRLASHCTDGMGHGLLPGPHEGWFDWKME
ncbi:MAG: hypothetical protein AAF702_38835 [Chloroflexota bacterium]